MTTLTANIATLVGGVVPSKPVLVISAPVIKDSTGNKIYSGGRTVPFADDGTLTTELLPTNTAGTEPSSWQYRFHVKWNGGELLPFTAAVTGSAIDLADIQPVNPADPIYLPSEILSSRISDFATAVDARLNAAGREKLALADYDKLRPFFADLANWRNKRVDIGFMGDSNPEGFALTAWNDTSPSQLAAMMRARLGITTGARGFVGIQHDKVNKPFWPHVYTGGTISNTGYGANGRQIGLLGTGQKFVHTVATPLTSFYIHHALFSTGTFYYKIDGGANVNVVVNGTGTIVPSRTLVNLPVTSTIEIGWVSGQAYIGGIQENKGDENAGLQVHNFGWSSTYAKLWNDRTVPGPTWRGNQAVLAPQLMVVNLGGNDGVIATGNRTAAEFATDLATLFGHLQTSVAPTAPIVFNMQWNLGDSYLREPWVNYVAAAKAVCAANAQAVCVDHSARMYASNGADPLALYNAASLPHASPKGYALYAATLLRALEPR